MKIFKQTLMPYNMPIHLTTVELRCYRLVFMRDDAFARVGDDGPDYIIDRVNNNVNEDIYRFDKCMLP